MNIPNNQVRMECYKQRRQRWIYILCVIGVYFVFFSGHLMLVLTTNGTTNDHIMNTKNSIASSTAILNHTLLVDFINCSTDTSILPENWCLDMNGIPRYIGTTRIVEGTGAGEHGRINNHSTNETERPPMAVPPKIMKHYTHDGYDKCLGNKTVVFIGDSRVRYQFMYLAWYLNSKKHMRCQDYKSLVVPNLQSLNGTDKNKTDPPHWYDSRFRLSQPECFLIDEKLGSNNWTLWYKKSTLMLDSRYSSHGDESLSTTTTESQFSLCDCFRADFVPMSTYENRFIQRSTVYGTANLIYLQNFQNYVRLNEQFPPFSSFDIPTINITTQNQRCNVGECQDGNRKNVFQGNLNETLWKILPRLNTTHAFVSLGWEHLFPFDAQSDFSCVIQDFERHHPEIKVYLISHPPEVDKISNPLESFDIAKLKCDIKVLDRTSMSKNVPSSWYWDNLHVLSILNEEYNHQLMEKICPLESRE